MNKLFIYLPMRLKTYLIRKYTLWIRCIVFNEGISKVHFDLSKCVQGFITPQFPIKFFSCQTLCFSETCHQRIFYQ
jgi:hypothetical protein